MDFSLSTNELIGAAGRSLGSLTSKFLHMGNMDYETYTNIFDNTVIPILDYAAGVWGVIKSTIRLNVYSTERYEHFLVLEELHLFQQCLLKWVGILFIFITNYYQAILSSYEHA